MTSPIKFVEGPAPTAVPAPTAIPAQIGEAGHPPRSRVADSESARGTLAGEAVCVETGACVHSEVVFRTESTAVSHKRSRRPARSWRAGGRTPRARRTASRVEGGTAILARSRNPRALAKSNNLHTRVETTRPPHAAPLSVACPPPHPRSPRRPPRHVCRENHRRRSGGRHGWP